MEPNPRLGYRACDEEGCRRPSVVDREEHESTGLPYLCSEHLHEYEAHEPKHEDDDALGVDN